MLRYSGEKSMAYAMQCDGDDRWILHESKKKNVRSKSG